jgi:hypothetical protein
LQADNQVLVRGKNEIVGELDFAIEVLATALGVELDDIMWQNYFLVPVMMPHAMYAFSGGIAKTACQVVVFSTVMELQIPADRDEQHHEGHQ